MRLIKLSAVAAIAVVVVVLVGASSASAVTYLEEVVICEADVMGSVLGCPSGSVVELSTLLDAALEAGTKAKILTNLGTVECTESETNGETSSVLAHGLLNTILFTSCKLGGTSCTVIAEHRPYLFLVLLTANHTEYHAILSEHGSNGKPRLLTNCGKALECAFGASEFLFTVLLSVHDTVWDINQELEREGGSGFLCPATSTLQSKYLVRCLRPIIHTFKECWPAMEEGSVL